MRRNNRLSLIFFMIWASIFQYVYGQEYTISGYISMGLYPLEDVIITASNGGDTTLTNADGYYSLSLPSGWSGTITPSKIDYEFRPENRSYSNLAGDSTDQDFNAYRIIEVSGHVWTTDGPTVAYPYWDGFTEPVVGARVCDGDPSNRNVYRDTTYTDSTGYYCFLYTMNFPWIFVGPIWVDRGGDFPFYHEGNIQHDMYDWDFHVYVNYQSIIWESSGKGMPGVSVTAASNDGKSAVTVTGIDPYSPGNYIFYLNYNFTGTITPSKPGWVFDPPYRSYSNLIKDLELSGGFVGTPYPDLQCNSAGLAISPTTVEAGNMFNISGVIENQGAISTGTDFQVNLFICPNNETLEFGSSHFLDSFIVSTLDSGLTASFNETVTVPLSATPGTYYAWVSIDPPDAVSESDETNNQQSCSTQLVVNATGIEPENTQSITHFELRQNVPNPFNPMTRIQYQLPRTSHVNLGIYNLMGQELVRLVDEVKETGIYSVEWGGRDSHGAYLPSGIYIYQIKAGEFTESKKLILSR